MAERQRVVFPLGDRVACGRGGRQVRPAHGEQAHGAFGYLPLFLKMQKRNGVQSHIAVIVNGQRQGKAVIGHQIVIPFFDMQCAGLDVRTAVDRQELFGIARLAQIAVFVQFEFESCGTPFCII